jgi:hypothetical protein
MSNPVMAALQAARIAGASSEFERWCIRHRVQPLPVAPANVALFIRDSAPLLTIQEIGAEVQKISQSHIENGFADPTAGGPVASVINEISKIEPPRSWSKQMKARFPTLPHDIQVYLEARERQRDTEVRRAQNLAAEARKALAEATQPQSSKENENEKPVTPTAGNADVAR